MEKEDDRVHQLEEKIEKIEVNLETLKVGQSLMADALVRAGILTANGEPVKVKAEAKWDPTRIKWRNAQGTRGPYERYPLKGEKAESTSDYHNLLADLKKHDGKLSRDGIFYWLFQDGATVGRKRRK